MVEGNKSAGLEKIQAAFSEKYPNVTFENSAYSQGTDYFAQLQTAIASGDMPEIMMGNPGLYTDLIEGGYVMDLTGNAVIEGLGLTRRVLPGQVVRFPRGLQDLGRLLQQGHLC